MVKTLLKQIGEYKRDTIITPVFTVLEVVAELLVPFAIASLIDKGIGPEICGTSTFTAR